MFFVFLPFPPDIVVVFTLALALYLSVIELVEAKPHYLWWIWWLLLVLLTHFVGYLALRGYRAYRRRDTARA